MKLSTPVQEVSVSHASHRPLRSTSKETLSDGEPFDGPLFIVGTGRCGSTLFHDLLTRHPDVSFMTPLANRHPTKPIYNRLCIECINLAGDALRRKYFPVEAYRFWDQHFRGFSRPFRDLRAADATPGVIKSLRRATRQFASPRRPFMIFKITGWPRIGFLQAVFPRAKFISVIRDGRSVANSLLNVHFWDGWLGPERWSWGPLDPERHARWHRYDRSFVALAGLQWEILMDSYRQAKAAMPDPSRLLEIRYEELCSDPLRVFHQATSFIGLEFKPSFERAIASARLRDANQKWREDLDATQQAILNDCLSQALEAWGYASSSNSTTVAESSSRTTKIEPKIQQNVLSLS
jgi:hypothetical protein